LLTLLFLFLGFKFSGLGGMILAVPVGLILIEFYKFGAFDPLFGAIRELVDFVNDFRRGAPQQSEGTSDGTGSDPGTGETDEETGEDTSSSVE
ncbi:MAG: hypothetical protein J6I64_03050, partial [Lachnospiraceae bacterium]|nr:hypothetical protein [Lachnospiraceae bacterium]